MVDHGTTKKIVLHCERCGKVYRFPVTVYESDGESTGIMNVLIRPPCTHAMVVSIDRNGTIRGVMVIDKECVDLESIRIQDHDDKIAALERKHDRVSRDGNYNEAFKILEQLRALKNEKKEFEKHVRKG